MSSLDDEGNFRGEATRSVAGSTLPHGLSTPLHAGTNKAKKGGAPNTGVSEQMNKKTFVDASGRKGKVRPPLIPMVSAVHSIPRVDTSQLKDPPSRFAVEAATLSDLAARIGCGAIRRNAGHRACSAQRPRERSIHLIFTASGLHQARPAAGVTVWDVVHALPTLQGSNPHACRAVQGLRTDTSGLEGRAGRVVTRECSAVVAGGW